MIQQLGGLKPKAALDPFDGHAAMVDALPVMAAKDDKHLVDWSPSRAAQMRARRCQTIPTDRAPDQGKFCPLETPTCQPDTVITNQIQQSMPAICGFSDEPLPAMREVIQFLVVPVKDPLGLAATFAERLAQAWGLLSDVMHNMKTYPNKELPGAFPFAQYYDSALIAYRLFFAREAQPVAGETRWQKDALNKDAFEHLSLTDLESALAISLRRTLYTTISFWQNAFVDFINGKDKWADWPENLKITLDDYWAMPVYRGPFNELDLSQAGEDSQAQFKNYAHRRWEHLYNLSEIREWA